jgi:hypothetical protein
MSSLTNTATSSVAQHIKPAQFVHVVYRSHRFDEMISWCQKVLGGVEFDSNAWLARLRGGGPEATFMVRAEHLPIASLRNP